MPENRYDQNLKGENSTRDNSLTTERKEGEGEREGEKGICLGVTAAQGGRGKGVKNPPKL